MKIPGYALVHPSTQGILASGGEGILSVVGGGVALYLYQSKIYLEFKKAGLLPVRQDLYTDISGSGDQWLHVAGTWKQDGAARLYIDGAEVAAGGPSHTSLSTALRYLIPKMQVGRTSNRNQYGAFTLDEWYFWDKELTGNQVKQIYDSYKTGASY